MPAVKVILLSDLHSLGRRGDVVQTKTGYARNYLIPQGLAVQATVANTKWFEEQRKKIDARSADERETAAGLASELDGVEITIAKRVGETETLYGSVTASDIHEALEAKGFTVDRRQIDLHGGIKTLGEHEVRILLHGEVTAVVDLTVGPEE